MKNAKRKLERIQSPVHGVFDVLIQANLFLIINCIDLIKTTVFISKYGISGYRRAIRIWNMRHFHATKDAYVKSMVPPNGNKEDWEAYCDRRILDEKSFSRNQTVK